jgi:hypothetical protein
VALEPPRYRLYVESAADDAGLQRLGERLERELREVSHYRYCRELGQLGPVTAVRIRDGRRAYEAALMARGVKPGDIKPTCLDARPIWADALGVPEGQA